MEPLRSVKVSVNITPDTAARLDRLRRRNHWTRSTAAAVLLQRALDAEGRPPPAGSPPDAPANPPDAASVPAA